ncbi:MAG TPA: 4-hydroxy-tetrahydrodipicolinate synthase [Actinomycetota bacterium]|nr:4-hydroxy-tetrahydrodipicolinate synthase [Actinomycetota bacterium]
MGGRFGNLITAMVTPFDGDGKVDFDAAQKLAAWLMDNGSDGIVVAGSTGEASTLTDGEQRDLWKAVKEAVGGRGKVIGGTGSNDTAHAIFLTQAAEQDGLDAALVVTPYYNKPPQAGLLAHFRAVAGSTSLPVIVYDIPARSVTKIEHSTLIELAQVTNIVAVKDAVGSVQGAARLVADAPEGFQVYSGNDADTLPWLSVGAVGVIAVASHVVGPQMAEMIRLFTSGDPEGARKIHLDLMPVFDAMSLTTNPIPVKASLELMGHRVGAPRLPLIPADDAQRATLKAVLTSAGVL